MSEDVDRIRNLIATLESIEWPYVSSNVAEIGIRTAQDYHQATLSQLESVIEELKQSRADEGVPDTQ